VSSPAAPDAVERTLLRDAWTAVRRGDVQRADALFLQHLEAAPGDGLALGEYGHFCLRSGRPENAAYLLRRASALLPDAIELSNLLGYARVELKDFAAARAAFETVLAREPAHAQANFGLGTCLREQGAWAEAAEAFAKALAATTGPNTLPVVLNLAEALHRAGDAAQARAHYERAQAIAPDDPALLLAFGRFLREQGDPAAGMRLIDRCAARHPDEPRLLLEKARCLRALGDLAHATRWLERLERLAPGNPDTSVEAGECLLAAGDRAGAFAHWLRAADLSGASGAHAAAEPLIARMLALDPRSAAAWHARGVLDRARNDFAAAEAAWRTSLACEPGRLDASANLALLLEETNRVADARALAESSSRTIDTARDRRGANELLFVLAKTLRRGGDTEGALRVLDRIAASSPDDTQRMAAAFERGKLLDLRDEPATAIAAFAEGNAIAQARWMRANPGRNRFLAGLDFMLDAMRGDAMHEWPPIAGIADHPDVAFLVGFPRSGTTLLNQVFDGHPAIEAIEEKPMASRVTAGLRAMPRGYPHALAGLDADDVGWLREAYFRGASEHGASDRSKLLLDKFPANSVVAGMLHRVFPRARFVFALRHPCDVVLSCFMQSFELNNTMANFCTLADTVALYTRTMDLWQAWRDALPGMRVHAVRYEDVVDDFDGQVRALCDFLGVAWRDDLRAFHAKALERGRINTPSYEQVSRPIYREARYRWERYREFLEPHLPALRPYIERFGYAQ